MSKPVTEPGFEVNIGAGSTMFFPLIPTDRFRQGDIRLIVAATGMEWDKWLNRLKQYGLGDPITQQGFFAVAVQRARGLDQEAVVSFIDDLPLIDGVKIVFPPASEEEKESPPAEGDETES